MAAAELARKVMRDVRNRWSYEEVENFVRDATSNTSDPPNPRQIRQIAEAMLYYETYPKAFSMLWRRLTHLEYKRHVAKALLVLDSLVRIRPPSKAVQLKLMVDIRERWPEIYRLAKLRPSSSSETISQIQRVAERLCAFIMGYESGYIVPQEEEEEEDEEEEEEERRRRKKRSVKRKKKKTTIEEEEVAGERKEAQHQEEEEGEEEEGDESEGELDHEMSTEDTRAPSSQQQLPPVSPFGFDFFQHTNFEWTPPPGGAPAGVPSAFTAPAKAAPAATAGWPCKACTFVNSPDNAQCEICGGGRFVEMEEEVKVEEKKEEKQAGWECQACSFINKDEAEQCEVCETKRGLRAPLTTAGEGGEGEGEDAGEDGHSPGEEKEDLTPAPPIGGSQLPGAWACSYCSWLNPPTATHCEVCEREGKRSDLAQLVKLEIASKYREQAGEAEGGEAIAGQKPWSCSVCTFVNPATRVACAACGAQSPYATELLLTGGAGSSYTSAAPSPALSPKSRRASNTFPANEPLIRPSSSVGLTPPPSYPLHPTHPHHHPHPHDASMDSLAIPESLPPGVHPHQPPQRRTGFAQGYSEPTRRLSAEPEGKEMDAGDAEALRLQQSEINHQVAALEHYKKQKEAYKQQYGWSCAMCSFLNDPQHSKCEMCSSPRPALTAAQQLNQAQVIAQQPRMEQSPSSQPALAPSAVKQQSRPSLPTSSPAMPVAAAVIPRAVPSVSPVQPAQAARVAASAAAIPTLRPAQPQQQLPGPKPSPPSAQAVPAAARVPVPPSTPPLGRPPSVLSPVPSVPAIKPIVPTTPPVSIRAPPSSIPSPDVVPQPKLADWACDVCTFLNGFADPNCIMCNAPKPLTISVANQAENPVEEGRTTQPSTSPYPSIPTSPPIVQPPIPSSQPSATNRRSTQPVPVTRPMVESPVQKRLSLLDGVPASDLRGPAPVPGGEVRFPAQFQQQAAQQAMAQEMARREAAAREAALTEQRVRAQRMLEATAAQQLQSLPPLSSQSSPPSQQRQLLMEQEQWMAEQHAQAQREQQQRQSLSQGKPALDSLINDFFSPRAAERPVELPKEGVLTPSPQMGRGSAPPVPAAPPVGRPPTKHKHGASADFWSLVDSSADGLAQDFLGRKSPAPGEEGGRSPAALQRGPTLPSPLQVPGQAPQSSQPHRLSITAPPSSAGRLSPIPPSPEPISASPVPGVAESPQSARSARSESPQPPLQSPLRPAWPPVQVETFKAKPPPPAIAPPPPRPPSPAPPLPPPPAVAPPVPVRHERVDSWEERARLAAEAGQQITPFDTPQFMNTPQFVWPKMQGEHAEGEVRGEEGRPGERGEGEGERGGEGWRAPPQSKAKDFAVPTVPPPQPTLPPLPLSIQTPAPVPALPSNPLPLPSPPSPVPSPSSSIAPHSISTSNPLISAPQPPPPKKAISAEGKVAISSLAAALAASAASPATVRATQSPAAEAAAARKLAPAMEALPEVKIVGAPAPAVVAPIPIKRVAPPPPSAIVLPRGPSVASITHADDTPTPSTPVSTSRPSSQKRSPSSQKGHQADMRERVREEILSTEKFYVECLGDLTRHYMEPIKKLGPKMGVEPRHVSAIFGNLTVLAQFHAIFLEDLKKNPNTSAVFVQFADFLKMYTQYIAGYEKSIATINSLRGNKGFQKLMEEKRDELKGRGIMTYLIMPVQRIPRYVLLLRELKKYTPPEHPENESLCVALSKIESIAEFVNESKRHVENMSKLLDIQNRLKRTESFTIFKPDRRLIKEGMIRRLKEDYVLEGGRQELSSGDVDEHLFFLFNDLLLWTTVQFDIVGHVKLEELLCLPDQAFGKVPFVLSLGVKGKPYCPDMVFACKDQMEKDEWTRYILSAINTATDPSKHRKTAALGSGGKGLPTSQMVPTSAGSHSDDHYDPPSKNSYSVSFSSRSQSTSQSHNSAISQSTQSNASSSRPSASSSTSTMTPPPPPATGGSSVTAKKESAVTSKTTALPSLPLYELPPLPSTASPAIRPAEPTPAPSLMSITNAAPAPVPSSTAAAVADSSVGPPRVGLSSSALLQQVLHTSSARSSLTAGGLGSAGLVNALPPPLLSAHHAAPPPLMSAGAPPPLLSGLKGMGEEKEDKRPY